MSKRNSLHSSTQTVLYNSNTILLVQKNMLQFISVIPLIQEFDLDIADEKKIEAYQDRIAKIVKQLEGYDSGSLLRAATYGATYKIHSLYTRLSPIQKFVRDKDYAYEDILNQVDSEKNPDVLSFD